MPQRKSRQWHGKPQPAKQDPYARRHKVLRNEQCCREKLYGKLKSETQLHVMPDAPSLQPTPRPRVSVVGCRRHALYRTLPSGMHLSRHIHALPQAAAAAVVLARSHTRPSKAQPAGQGKGATNHQVSLTSSGQHLKLTPGILTFGSATTATNAGMDS